MTDEIDVHLISGKKVVIRHYGIYLDASIADFVVFADHVLLQHFYLNGVCSRRSIGFGMVDVVEEGEA